MSFFRKNNFHIVNYAFLRDIYFLLSLLCSPPPNVSYVFDSIDATPLNGKLVIRYVTRAIQNKKIMCTGTSNGRGTKNETFTINVEYPPTVNMTIPLLPFIRNSENAAYIFCNISSANPKPTVTFYFNDQPIRMRSL